MLLENCFLKGPPPLPDADKVDENASAWKGIYIASHSQVTMKQCTVANFDVGLRVRGTGHLTISSSLIEMCNIGLLVILLLHSVCTADINLMSTDFDLM